MFKKWWEKDVLDLEGPRMEALEAELWEREGGGGWGGDGDGYRVLDGRIL